MTLEDILKGESKNVEFKSELPKRSDKYMKSIIAFSNTSGGKLMIGIDDKTRTIIGVDKEAVFYIMDSIANGISDCCEPQIIPDITFQTIDGKCIVIVEIYPGANRPYYLKHIGKEKGTYLRVAGTSRPADQYKIKELELEGLNLSWDELTCVGYHVSDEAIEKLCQDIHNYMVNAADTEEEKNAVSRVTKEQLLNWKILKKAEG